MYKLLLCWRYLRTRYIALASIISVMLGVATMIVVNSVMAGFTTEMKNRIHGILADMVFESRSLEGFRDPEWHMEQIRRVAGDAIAGMSPTVVVPAMISFQARGISIVQPVELIGIDERTQAQVSDFGKYLQHPENRRQMSFELREGGYDVRDHQAGPEAPDRCEMAGAGWPLRRANALEHSLLEAHRRYAPAPRDRGAAPGPVDPFAQAGRRNAGGKPVDPFHTAAAEGEFNPAKRQHTGLVMGMAMSAFRYKDGIDHFLVLPGDDVKMSFPTAGMPPKIVSDEFTVVDFYESKMSEFDQKLMFVPLRELQVDRGMHDPTSGQWLVNKIQIKLKPGADLDAVRNRLREAFNPQIYSIYTWRDQQGALLAAVQMETAILNVLLFMIIAVAGFGILAVFFMIVVEKTRDIGVLKSLGASGFGILGIFLAYGLSLGLVGSSAGLAIGLLFVKNINAIANALGAVTGQKVFDPAIYYFYSIPTLVNPATIAWIVAGAMSIAVLASVLPALRAAMLHPVEALRYE
jgi:lipoprotein-releasing system permease protein